MTAKPVIPRQRAREDVDDAIEHYVAVAGSAVALRFVDALDETFGRLSRHPLSGSPRYAQELGLPGLRSMRLQRFPHLVFYVDQPDHVDVWRVLHGERDLPAWLTADDAQS